MAENLSSSHVPVAQQGPQYRGSEHEERLEHLFGGNYPATDMNLADEASVRVLRGLGERVPEGQRRVLLGERVEPR